MNFKQRVKNILLLLLTASFCGGLNAQTLPLHDPNTYTEWRGDNRAIAEAFAPVLIRFFNDSDNSNGGRYDFPVRVNFDGDWNHLNNWENANTLDNITIDPEVYFHVHWTDDYWIVTYSFYYPRDYAKPAFCNFAKHEGDMERVYVYIDRPSIPGYVAEELLRGYAVTNHGKKDHVNCLTPEQKIVSTDSSPSITDGAHPIAYSSAGSHAMYACIARADDDTETSFGARPCRPTVHGLSTLSPVLSSASTGPGDIRDAFGYKLIDLSDPAIGLWGQRSNTAVFEFSSIADRDDQKFNGDDPDKASAPWNGTGYNPYELIGVEVDDYNADCTKDRFKFGDPFRCGCNVPIGNCTPMTFTPQDYSFNPMRCEGYVFNEPVEFSDRSIYANIIHHGFFDSLNDDVEWTIESNGIQYSCDGCDQKGPNITLIPEENGFCSTTYEVTITATIISIECGTTTFSQTLSGTLTADELGDDELAGTSLLQNRIYNFGDSDSPGNPQQIVRTYNRILQDITASNGGELWVNRAGRIAFTDESNNPFNTLNSSYAAYIGGCEGAATVTIGDGGKFWIGENDNTSNIAKVYIEEGSSVIIQDGGLVDVDRPSQLVVRSGGVLKVENGGTLRTNRTGQIIIEEGGQLIIDDGAEINLWWSDANILIQGELVINGQFKFVGSGYFQFDSTHELTLNSDFHLTGNGSRFIQLNKGATLKIGDRHINLEHGRVLYDEGSAIDLGDQGSAYAYRVDFESKDPFMSNVAVQADGASKIDLFFCTFNDLFAGIFTTNGIDGNIYRTAFCNFNNCSIGVWAVNHPDFESFESNYYGGSQSLNALKADQVNNISFLGGNLENFNLPGLGSSAVDLTDVAIAYFSGTDLLNNTTGIHALNVLDVNIWGGEIRNSSEYGIHVPVGPLNTLNTTNIRLRSGTTLEENVVGIQIDKGGFAGDGALYGKVLMNCASLIHNDVGVQGQDIFLEIDAYDHCDCQDPAEVIPNTFIKNSIPQDFEEFFIICYDELKGLVTQVSARGNYWAGGLNAGSDYILNKSNNEGICNSFDLISLDTSSPASSQPEGCNNGGPTNPKEEKKEFGEFRQGALPSEAEESLVVFPNPADQIINLSAPSKQANVVIFNTLGERVYQGQLTSSNLQLDVSNWTKGMYLIQVKDINTKNEWVKKLVVQ